MAVKTERIIDHLLSCNQELLRSQPPNLVKLLHTALASVKRGQNKQYGELNKYMTQTNLGHTIAMLDMLHDISYRLPNITRGLNIPFMETMITFHDIGEAHPKIGDVPSCGPDRESEDGMRRKRFEPKFAYLFIGMIPNPEIRMYARSSYFRNWLRDHRDPEAQLVQVLDKGEGTSRGDLEEIYTRYPEFGYTNPPQVLIDSMEQNLAKLMIPICHLAPLLDISGRNELLQFSNEELDKVEAAGYGNSVHYARNFLKTAIRYPRPQTLYIKTVRELAVAS